MSKRSPFYSLGSPQNIITVFNMAELTDVEEGAQWYYTAHDYAVELASRYGITVPQVAGVLAALSPSCPWDRNKGDANRLIRWYTQSWDIVPPKVCTYGSQRDKAIRILRGEDPVTVLGGRKTQNFFKMIEDPSKDYPVIDVHAFGVWIMDRLSTDKMKTIHDNMYDHIGEQYREAAEELGLRLSVVQATTWVTWRKLWEL